MGRKKPKRRYCKTRRKIKYDSMRKRPYKTTRGIRKRKRLR